MKEFKMRCSAIGQMMGIKGIGKTGEGYLETWVKEQIYNRRKEFSNKYTDKGITVEDNSIDYIAEQLGYGMLLKNEEYFENDYLTGTPDVILKDLVIDVKNSWDCFTFPLFADSVPNKAYYWQLQGYMSLTGLKSAKLIYTLLDTPLHIVDNEFNWNNKLELDYDDFVKPYQYEHIPDKYRIKIFDIERNDADIAKIGERVEECRTYINTLLKIK